jgi:aspartyl-tRNA(Asn)/glutamyl-tRNA(Gln) amidotransferase subunit A
MQAALSKVDLLLTPTTPTGPFPVSQPAEPAALMLNDIMTIPASLAGLPAVAVPVDVVPSSHVDRKGRPVPVPLGLQLIGRWADEASTLRAAAAIEALSGFADKVPSYVREGVWHAKQ